MRSFIERAVRRARFDALDWLLSRHVDIAVGGVTLRFHARSSIEYWRARSLPEKEAGTVKWIVDNVQPGDTFVDVGANVGIYTLLAAARGAKVLAFEPHLGNAESLLANVRTNGLLDRVDVYSVALADRAAFAPFNYHSLVRGSSQSQYGTTVDDSGVAFEPVGREMKWAVPFDDLGVRPDLVKIDVDGNEGAVLGGMKHTLTSPGRPRSVQVEIGHRNAVAVREQMQRVGYGFDHRHDTSVGLGKLAAGVDPDDVAHNAVYVPYAEDRQRATRPDGTEPTSPP